MASINRIQKAYDKAQQIAFSDLSRFVIFSDCHRGDGNTPDNFEHNQNLYLAALKHYYKNGFTYIELGDGDELWENSDFSLIAENYEHIFKQLAKFNQDGRMHLIYGNHDIVKKSERWVRDNLVSYFNGEQIVPLLGDVKVHESLVLRHKHSGNEIFLLHGHQADFFNDTLWPLSKFLVKYLWRPLESVGVKNPTSASANSDKKRAVEQNLIAWVQMQKQRQNKNIMLVAGHTHRSMMPKHGDAPYFNDGCCVYPRHITAIEIQDGMICLVKWCVETREDDALFIAREQITQPVRLDLYFGMQLLPQDATNQM